MKVPTSGLRIDNPAFPLLQAEVTYWGSTSAAGAATGTTLVDALCSTAGLQPSYVGQLVKLLSGNAAGQVREIATHNLATGALGVANAFTDYNGAVYQVPASTRFCIISSLAGGGAGPVSPSIGLWMFGVCDPGMAGSTTVIVCTNLAGFPDDIFNNEFWMQVIHNDNAPGTAPEREWRRITDYVGATGTFTTDAFTVNVEANDLVAIVHESIMRIEILGFGTLDASSATVPADSTRAEGNDYFNGCLLMTTEGAVRFQPRRIVDYTGVGGIFTIDPNNPFTAATGLVDYIIIGDQTEFVPAADGANNRTPSDVIGNKTSTAIYTPDNTSDVIRYLKGILDTVSGLQEPTSQMVETWQNPLGIDNNVWAWVNPATGAAWDRTVAGAFIYAEVTPNANEVARLRSILPWEIHSITPNLNLIVKKTIMEFEMVIGVPDRVDNAAFFVGFMPGVADTRASNNIIGFGLNADVLESVTDLAGVETTNTGFGETLTNHNKLRIEIYEAAVDFYVNEVLVATHVANIPNLPSFGQFYIDTEAGGACAFDIGLVKLGYEMAERY